MNFLNELKRRNVLRVGAAYIVTAWLVIQVVETIFPAFGFGDAAVRYVTIAAAIALVPVLVLAWVFEWTPEGLVRDEEVDHARPASLASARRLDHVILVMLALALGYFAFDKFMLDPARDLEIAEVAREEGRTEALIDSYGDASIAVLAFADMSQDKDQEYLSDGIAEEILHLLEKIDGLRVISRTSAFSYKGKDTPIPAIAEQLNVAHILEGSVRKAGDRIRVTAQLIEARTDTHIWSKTYDRTLDDIFAIQDELAAAMVEQLQIELLGEAPVASRIDPEAYLLWLEGHYNVAYVDSDKAALLLEQAVEIEPDYFDAWVDLARAYFQMSTTFAMKDHEGDENYFKGEAAWNRAQEIDPDHPTILAGGAWSAVEDENDYHKAARLMEQAIETAPDNWEVIRMAAFYGNWIRRDDVVLALLRPVVARDPLCPDCSYRYARAALFAGHYREAEQEIIRFKSLVPRQGGEITLATARLMQGDFDGARAAIRRPENESERNRDEMAARGLFLDLLIRIRQGEMDGVLEGIERLDGMRGEGISVDDIDVAELYAMASRHDEAFSRLEATLQKAQPFVIAGATRSPFLANLHEDPRWMELLELAGVAPHQLAEIEFNPKLPQQGPE